MAISGKGKYFAVTDTSSTAQLTGFLQTILQEVQAVNSVFASTTLPVSVNVRGTNLNQVYIGVFRPDRTRPALAGQPQALTSSGSIRRRRTCSSPTPPARLRKTPRPASSAAMPELLDRQLELLVLPRPDAEWRQRFLRLPRRRPGGKGGAAQRLRVSYPGPLVGSPDNTARKVYTCLDTT